MYRPSLRILAIALLAGVLCARRADAQGPYSPVPFGQPSVVTEPLPAAPPGFAPAPSFAPQMNPPTRMPVVDGTNVPFPYPPDLGNGIGPYDPYVATAPSSSLMDELFGFNGFGKVNCTASPNQSLVIFHGYSGWRGISEGSGGNNNGFLYGLNFGSRLGEFSELTGIGAQFGASYGLYDLNGRSSGFENDQIQQQTFVTTGLFRRPGEWTNLSGGVVFDAMFNDNFGQFAVSPFLGQVRGQIALALNDRHEIGFWTALRVVDSSKDGGALQYRGVDQFNFFWHHKFTFGADGVSWIGFPDPTKLGGSGSLGNYIFGGTLNIPLSPWFGAYTDLQYMPSSATIGATAANSESFYIGLGLMFYPGRNALNTNVAGQCWTPYIPVANNGTFMVDTNRTF
jgi:hypothetical protein